MASYYVSKVGSDSNNGTTWALAKLTIAGAIAVSTTGDTINIGAGDFAENVTMGNARTYSGVSMVSTVISGTFTGASTTCVFSNLKLNISSFTSNMGSGLLTFNSVRLEGNNAVWPSLMFYGSSGTLNISYSIFSNISGQINASFIAPAISGVVNIQHSVFYNVAVASGYLIESYSPNLTIQNSIIHTCKSFYCSTTFTRSYNCIYNSVSGWTLQTGEIAVDPKFVDPANGDFRLQPTSPCIGTGHA